MESLEQHVIMVRLKDKWRGEWNKYLDTVSGCLVDLQPVWNQEQELAKKNGHELLGVYLMRCVPIGSMWVDMGTVQRSGVAS